MEGVSGWVSDRSDDEFRKAEPLRVASDLVHVHTRALDLIDEWDLLARARAGYLQNTGDWASLELMRATRGVLAQIRRSVDQGICAYVFALTAEKGVDDIQAIATVTRRLLMTEDAVQGLAVFEFVASPKADRMGGVATKLLIGTAAWAERNGLRVALEPDSVELATYQQTMLVEDVEDESHTFRMVTLDFTPDSSANYGDLILENETHGT